MVASTLFFQCAYWMRTTVLGSCWIRLIYLGVRVNEGELPGNTICPLGKPEDRGWMDEQPRARKRAPWGVKSPKRAARAQYQATPYAPWASQRIGAGWEQPRAAKRAPWGVKSPKTSCASAALDVSIAALDASMVVTSQYHGHIHVG
ncbi:hypothetical protein B0H14DRAFT_2609466 [Mycena olivaceomarginata]|nr:hypothetical protein B0H14DRAFT_2609466 [Mycena olivaceomarginata]